MSEWFLVMMCEWKEEHLLCSCFSHWTSVYSVWITVLFSVVHKRITLWHRVWFYPVEHAFFYCNRASRNVFFYFLTSLQLSLNFRSQQIPVSLSPSLHEGGKPRFRKCNRLFTFKITGCLQTRLWLSPEYLSRFETNYPDRRHKEETIFVD